MYAAKPRDKLSTQHTKMILMVEFSEKVLYYIAESGCQLYKVFEADEESVLQQ